MMHPTSIARRRNLSCVYFFVGTCVFLLTATVGNATLLNGTALNGSDNGPFLPKSPNFISCDEYYGNDLSDESCARLANDIFPGQQQMVWFSEWKKPFQIPWYKAPLVLQDPLEYPNCVVTIDLAGKTSSTYPLEVSTEALREVAKAIVDQCIIRDGKQQGGFGTARLTQAVKGLSEAYWAPTGYDAPLFFTVTVSGDLYKYKGPGQFDPIVNTNIRAALQKLSDKAWFKKTKDKISLVINALAATYERMNIASTNAWWNNAHFRERIPTGVSNLCQRSLGLLDSLQCERASFNFIRSGTTGLITPKKPIIFRYGHCAFEVKTTGSLAYSWDALRSAADSLLNECLLAEGAGGYGGEAMAIGGSQSNAGISISDSNSNSNSSVEARAVNGTTDDSNILWPSNLVLVMKSTAKPQTCSSLESNGCTLDDEETNGGGAMSNPSSFSRLPANETEATS